MMIKIYLSRLLGEHRINQTQLSKMTGIRPNTINDLYNEVAARISFEHLDKVCEALGCDLSDLLEYKPNPYRSTCENLIVEEHGNRKHNTK